MKFPWLNLGVLIAVAVPSSAHAQPDEPDKAQPPAVDPMRGKAPGGVRDDNGLKMKLVWCPPGKFKMGSQRTERDRGQDTSEDQIEVTLTQGYWLGKHAVTQSEWKDVMKTEPWKDEQIRRRGGGLRGPDKEGADFPVTFVNWDNVTDFCLIFTEQERQAEPNC